MDIDARKNVYVLLYARPLYKYIYNDGKNDVIDVLIAGDDDACTEAFKAVFWCGRMTSKTKLKITLCTNDPEGLRNKLKNALPALNSTILETDINFTTPKKLENKAFSYGWCFVSQSFEAEILKRENLTKKLADNDKPKNHMICYYSKGGNKKESEITKNKGEHSFDIVDLKNAQLFKDEITGLNRLAFNCDYAYMLSLDPRIKKGNLNTLASRENEQERYRYLSSLAFPIHIPYKLEICRQLTNCKENEKLDVLIKTIRKKKKGNQSELYNKLMFSEHNRWIAYMITEGWRMPFADELSGYAYQNGIMQYDKTNKLHPCICQSSENGGTIDKLNDIWEKTETELPDSLKKAREFVEKNYKGKTFSELELITLVLHSIVCKKAQTGIKSIHNSINSIGDIQNEKLRRAFEDLKCCIDKLIQRETGALELYRTAVERVKVFNNKEFVEKINDLEKKCSIIIERNKRKNYYCIDSTMIDAIPFCINYGKKGRTVITVSSGNAAEDVIVPTLFKAEKAVFLIKKTQNDYKQLIENYFSKFQKGNTKTEFKTYNGGDANKIYAELKKVIDSGDAPIINCVSCNDMYVHMAIGMVANDSNNGIPVYSYSHKDGLKCICQEAFEGTDLLEGYFMVDEYLSLINVKHTNAFSSKPMLYEGFEKLCAIFEKYSKGKMINGKKYVLWSDIQPFFTAAAQCRDVNERITVNNYFNNGESRKKIELKTQFLNDLSEAKLIKKVKTDCESGEASFRFTDSAVREYFINKGTVVEAITYYKLIKSGLFSDVCTGVEVKWDSIVPYDLETEHNDHNNEIDEIAFNGFDPVFISCKTSYGECYKDHKNEISSISNMAGASAVLVIADDIPETINQTNTKRMCVSVIGRNTLFDDAKMNEALKKIVNGETVISL